MPHTLIENATIVTMDGRRRVIERGALAIEGDRIVAVGPVDPKLRRADANIIDAAGKLVLPGLVNTHVHLSQQLARGLADDVDLLTWLRRRVWPYESNLTLEDSYVSSLACCLELIRSGVTCFAEAGGQEVDGMGRAVTEAGLRAILCQSTMDTGEGLPDRWINGADECLARQDSHFDRWHGQADGRLKVWYGLRTLFNCSDDLVRRATARAAERGVGVNMHLAEVIDEVRFVQSTRGLTPVRHMARLGALGPRLLAVHMVWPDAQEIDLLLRHDVKVSHNPAAAMRVLGFAPVPEMLAKGLCVGLGTDGAPCNNRMDLMDEMWLATLIHKGRNLNPTLLPAEQVLAMATIQGARCLDWDTEIGSLEPGKKADLIILDPRRPGSYPLHDPVGGVVNAMHASNVESSMCNGKWLMRDGRLLTLDEDEILAEAQSRALAIRARAGIDLPPRFSSD